MAIAKRIYLLAFFITLFLLISILVLGDFFNNKREDYITAHVQDTYNNLNEMQTFILMSEIYGNEMACLAFKSKLQNLDKSIWDLGIKIDRYRVATEEFQKDPFYLKQKKIFNENEVLYLMLLTKLNNNCNYTQPIILFFYRNSEDCKKCDDQSFVLTDIKKKWDDDVSIFSFDSDLNITTIKLLTQYYGVEEYPCIVVGGKFCGIRDKDFVTKQLCNISNISLCNA